MFELKIEIGNEAFSPDPGHEVARILQGVAEYLRNGFQNEDMGKLMDINGNTVGYWAIEE